MRRLELALDDEAAQPSNLPLAPLFSLVQGRHSPFLAAQSRELEARELKGGVRDPKTHG